MGEVTEKKVSISIPFSSPQHATLAYDVLSIDKEIKGSSVQRVITVDGTNLHIYFLAENLKSLRVATNAFLKNVLLVVKTVKQFNES